MEDWSAYVPDVHFEKIPIRNLVANQDYQRNLSISHVTRTAENFDLLQINPVKVSRRNGINYVFNGQHTIEVVARISGSRDTPVWCMVYDNLEYETEADIFANQQKYVKALSPYEIFMANIEAGNEKKREEEKDTYYLQQGIRTLRIKEYDHKRPKGEDHNDILWVHWSSDYSYLKSALSRLGDALGCCIDDVDIRRDSQQIWKEYLNSKAQNSLLVKFPEIAAEWDYERNSITPDVVTPYSRKKVHWICPDCGNRYEMIIGDRTGEKHCGCPPCGFAKRNQHQRLVQEKNIQAIANYRYDNPEATIAECARTIGLSYPTVKKYWKKFEKENLLS